jgi:hypothetical protein
VCAIVDRWPSKAMQYFLFFYFSSSSTFLGPYDSANVRSYVRVKYVILPK